MRPEEDIEVPEIESPALPDTEATDWNSRQGLAPKVPTKHSSPEVAEAWVKAVGVFLGMNISTWEIDEWCEEHEGRIEILKTYFPDQYEELCGDLLAAYENAKSLRF